MNREELIEKMAVAWSNAPYPSAASKAKARRTLKAIEQAGMVVVDRRVARSILQIAEGRAGWTLSKAEHEEFIIPMRTMFAAAEKGE